MLVIVAVGGIVFYTRDRNAYHCSSVSGELTSNGSCFEVKDSDKPVYKYTTTYHHGGVTTECSKPIKLVSKVVDKSGNAVDFLPADAGGAENCITMAP